MTPNNEDYRLYLDAKFDAVHEKLDSIEEQTKKTNGRVSILENQVGELQIKGVKHIIECPVKPIVEKMEEDLSEYRFFKKYPKIAIGILVVFMFIFSFSIYETYKKATANNKQNTEIIQQIDSLKYNR
jgi:hypothetical protein